MNRWSKAAVTLTCYISATSAWGQITPDPNKQNSFGSAAFPSLPVDLLPPGARALGLAGAFAAVADDATAAEANPAGMTILNQPEVSVHLRDSDYDIRFYDPEALDPGRFGGPPGQLIKSYEDSGNNVSFASFVKPFDRWVFSAFYQNQLDFSAATAPEVRTDTMFLDTYNNINALDAEVESFGLSAAFRLTDTFSIGVTVKNVDLEVNAFESASVDDFADFEFDLAVGGIGTPADFAAVINDRITATTSLRGDDDDTTFSVGLLLNPDNGWSFGIVYKEGGSFDIPGLITRSRVVECTGAGQLSDFCNAVFDLVRADNPTFFDDFNFSVTPFNGSREINIPDRITYGAAYRPSDTWLFSLDINSVHYSDLPRPRLNSLLLRQTAQGEQIEDELTYHFGVEKVFPLSGDFLNIFTVRAGVFNDEDHDGYAALDTDDTHYTFGIGAIIRNNLQIDLALESSDAVDNAVLSAIYRF